MGTSGENKESHIPKIPEKEDNVIIDPNTLEMNKLKNENKKLKDDISALSKQIEQFELDIQPEKPINSIKNNNNPSYFNIKKSYEVLLIKEIINLIHFAKHQIYFKIIIILLLII